MISTNEHITLRPKQGLNSGIGFSSPPTGHLACSLRSRKWVGTRGSKILFLRPCEFFACRALKKC